MQLYFIRHGQSTNNFLWEQTNSENGRSDDPELTELGRQQAEFVARFLSRPRLDQNVNGHDPQNVHGIGITHLYTSLMLRALQTATIIAQTLDVPLVSWKALHEGGGIYLHDDQGQPAGRPGKPRSFFTNNYPDLVLADEFGENGWWDREFEERPERIERASRVLHELRKRHGGTDHRVAVISHGAFYKYFLCALLELAFQDSFWFEMNNAAVSRFDFTQEQTILVYHNRLDYMPAALIS